MFSIIVPIVIGGRELSTSESVGFIVVTTVVVLLVSYIIYKAVK